MIPRFKPYLGKDELLAIFQARKNSVVRFEEAFARTFETQHALAFPYGRSGLWALFKALGLEGVEVIMPAYTCVVVAHATVLSNNIPRFVDITLDDYNMDLEQVAKAINKNTRVIVATHLFGYPLNTDQLDEIVRAAETRWGHKIWVVQDCAHAFGARWHGKLVCNTGDAALFGLGISKIITSILGGMVTTNDPELYEKLRTFRVKHFVQPNLLKHIRRLLYFLAIYPTFNEHIYGLVNWLEEKTPLLNRLTKAYHLDEKIHFPPDYLDEMLAIEAQVGLAQLVKYPKIVQRRQENAHYYDEHLPNVPGWIRHPLVEGATYSHYVVRVPDRYSLLKVLQHQGVQLGELIQYSLPHMVAYAQYVAKQTFPNSKLCSHSTINLPVQAHLTKKQRRQIAGVLRAIMTSHSILPTTSFHYSRMKATNFIEPRK